jgi:uncharacterized membrane protein
MRPDEPVLTLLGRTPAAVNPGPTSPRRPDIGRINGMTVVETSQPPAWKPLALLLAGSGVLHFVTPKPYESIVPRALGNPKLWVQVSGVAELVCAAGLANPVTRRLAGLASAGLFVAIYPANLDMAARAVRSPKASTAHKVALLGRLPLQIPLVIRALRLARSK